MRGIRQRAGPALRSEQFRHVRPQIVSEKLPIEAVRPGNISRIMYNCVSRSMPPPPPTLDGLESVLESIASDARIPPSFAEWIRESLRYGGRKIRILRYIQAHSDENETPRLLDIGAQFCA